MVGTRAVAGTTEAREVDTGVAVVAVTDTIMDLHATAADITHPHQAGSRLLLEPLASEPDCRLLLRRRTMVTVLDMVAEDIRSLMEMEVDTAPHRLRLVSTMAVVVVVGTKGILNLLLPVAMTTAMEAGEEDMAVVAGATIAVDMAMVVDTGVEKC